MIGIPFAWANLKLIPISLMPHNTTHREILGAKDQVNAFGQVQHRPRRVGVHPLDDVDPRPRGVHHDARLNRDRRAALRVANLDAARPRVAADRDDGRMVHDRGARVVRGLEGVEHETRVVRHVLRVHGGPLQALGVETRLGGERFLARKNPMPLVGGDRGELVEEREPDAQLVQARARAAVDRHEHRRRLGQVRRDPPQHFAFGRRLAHERDLALLEITQAAVDQLRRPAARAGGEVAGVDETDGETAQRRLARDTGPGDAAADHQEVERFGGEALEVAPARRRLKAGHARLAGVPPHASHPTLVSRRSVAP